MKKIFIAMLTLALALTVVAPVAASADTMASSFNTNLTVGSRGPAVVALQSFLISKGFLTVPATTALGNFGGLTKAALAAYQASKGITPAKGYFGPITRAAVIADSAATSPVTTTTTTTTTTNPVVTSTSNVEGTLDIRLASNPADNANVRTQNDVPVYGIEFRARIADVTVQTVDLEVRVTEGNNSENPATLINTIKVWDGSTVIASVPVSLTTFTKDQNQKYYYRVSGLNFVVPKDSTKTLTFSFSTNSIDSSRGVAIDGYQTSSVRAISGNGISSFYSIDGSGFSRTHTFVKPGTSSLSVTSATTPLRSQNYRNNGVDSLENVTLGTFNVKSETGDSTLLTVNTTYTGVIPTVVSLYQGSTLVKSMTGSSTVAFNNLDTSAGSVIAQNAIQTYTIKANYAASTTVAASSTVTVGNVEFQKPNGNTGTVSATIASAPVYMYASAPVITLAGTPTISITGTNQAGSSTAMTATFALNIAAQGGIMTLPTNSDFKVYFGTTTADAVAATSVSVVTIPNNNIADGSTASVTVTAQMPNSAVPQSGLYNASITGIKWTVGSVALTSGNGQTYGLEDFKTSSAANFIK